MRFTSLYTCIPKIICCMVPQIQSETDIIFCHFESFLPFQPPNNLENKNVEIMKKSTWRCYNFTHVHQKSREYDVCFLRYRVQQTEFFITLGPTNMKNFNFEKKGKKTTGDIILLHMCTKIIINTRWVPK